MKFEENKFHRNFISLLFAGGKKMNIYTCASVSDCRAARARIDCICHRRHQTQWSTPWWVYIYIIQLILYVHECVCS